MRTYNLVVLHDAEHAYRIGAEDMLRIRDREAATALARSLIRDGAYRREVQDPNLCTAAELLADPSLAYLRDRMQTRVTYTVLVASPDQAQHAFDQAKADRLVGAQAALAILRGTPIPLWAQQSPGNVKDACLSILKRIDDDAILRTLPGTRDDYR